MSTARLPRVIELRQTSPACPTQWEGRLDDDREICVRYRWGYLSVDFDGIEAFGKMVGHGMDGVLSFEQLVALTRQLVRWPYVNGASQTPTLDTLRNVRFGGPA